MDKETAKAQSYCFKNDIIIYIESVGKYNMIICVKRNGKVKRGEIEYNKKKQKQECAEKIYELYQYYYDKYN